MIIIVDFDGTLALGNKSHITLSEPNYSLIEKLKNIKKITNPYIKIVTARGSKNKLSLEDKEKRYKRLIEEFCQMYEVPYDEISFNKEYGDLYIDDMTINQYENFFTNKSYFTGNSLLFTEKTVIKKCKSSLFEKDWYEIATNLVNIPKILFVNDETIITERILNLEEVKVNEIIDLLKLFKHNEIRNYPFKTYKDNIIINKSCTNKVINIIRNLPEHNGTFFHGDLSTTNILKTNGELYLIDPNYKNIFGSYLTDAGKLFFSLIAYEHNYNDAQKIVDEFGLDVIKFAVAEGLRVTKYKEEYISLVNNIGDLI
jgi:tRNA A-37 threonylcarbamoyl transferase component Bud32